MAPWMQARDVFLKGCLSFQEACHQSCLPNHPPNASALFDDVVEHVDVGLSMCKVQTSKVGTSCKVPFPFFSTILTASHTGPCRVMPT